ncbi:site-specific integrase [Bradyrhizobium sp. IC3195]|uniref:tyrosine-type recombinase/integrase n=1 Tax=Bradyrhizobium sp. IC3195 TaxID=2793804 RepID=UPI001CD6132D|nr:site-specific integrase [Bradyrhizobium sp. IC3195]MCA1467239.1 site-specific integrase [Bradyrhizobium sp. IC3195]
MSVRKRTWKTSKGEAREAWIVDYVDQAGNRCIQTFERKKEADAYHATVRVEVSEGTHTPRSRSVTVREAGEAWHAACERNGLERSSLTQYRDHLDLHIYPYLGAVKLSDLSAPMVRDFSDKLLDGKPAPGTTEEKKRSPALVKKVVSSLGSLLADAQERGAINQNVVRVLSARRKRGQSKKAERRQRGKLKVGIDIPAPAEIRQLIASLEGRWRPLLLTAIFTGLRASELRGLRWVDVDLQKSELHVRQRADIYNEIGMPKSESGERTVPMPPILTNTLREWKLKCPRRDTGEKDETGEPIKALEFVFPNGSGNIESLSNILQRGLQPAMIAAGVTVPAVDAEGNPTVEAKYTGMHSLRHFYASWCINRRAEGGLELPLKVVSGRLGHSTIAMTADTYGHLFPRGDDGAELEAAERQLLSAT